MILFSPGTTWTKRKRGGNAACHWQPYWEAARCIHGLHWRNFALVKQKKLPH